MLLKNMVVRIVLISLLIPAPHVAMASSFIDVKLPRGVELKIPKGWRLITAEYNQLIDMSTEAAMDLSGVEASKGVEVNLIAANSMPRSTYAAIRVDSTTPVSTSPSEISNLTAAEIHDFQVEIESILQKLLPQQGNQVLTFFGVRRVTISGHPALITEYRRSGPKGPVVVSIVQVFTTSQELRFNLSYRESEQAIWKPVIGKIFQSIIIRQQP